MMRRWAVLGACAGMAGAVVVHAPAVWWSVLLSDANEMARTFATLDPAWQAVQRVARMFGIL